ncbi:TlpA family protein disulfide reductase [Flaviflexus huanghaiensis]|uniref:TlpA family protein disulfide reductase n=1 Tax=Flaviflexus huanghaiensis TaxID=1111473 RepID=UPI0015FB54D7|nr:TlpA disulfide reductase family protein [Flaviflexus huanghaiensis]
MAEQVDWRDRIRSSRLGSLFVVLVTTALIIAGVLAVKGGGEEAAALSEIELSEEASAVAPAVGEQAPIFSGLDIDGHTVDLETLDRPVWLIFNATWCSACRAEVPHIQDAQEEHGDKVDIVAIYVNEGAEAVRSYVDQVGLTYTHMLDPTTEIAAAYRTMGVPAHYFINSDGTISSIHVGAVSPSQIEEALAGLSASAGNR